MARKYYFESWEEAFYLIDKLDCYEAGYDFEHGKNVDVEGYDSLVTVFDEYGESIAESVVCLIREYPYEQYLIDKARLIDEGANPRCIMSYYATIAYEEYQATLEREREIEEAYDEYYKQMLEDLAEDERDRAISEEVVEIDKLLEFVEVIEENARAEIQAFGFVAPLEDLEELEDFALSTALYDELMDEFDELMTREYSV